MLLIRPGPQAARHCRGMQSEVASAPNSSYLNREDRERMGRRKEEHGLASHTTSQWQKEWLMSQHNARNPHCLLNLGPPPSSSLNIVQAGPWGLQRILEENLKVWGHSFTYPSQLDALQ